MNTVSYTLWITLVGMGLVFIAIVLLWGLMAAMVRLIKDKPEPGEEPNSTAEEITSQEDEYRPDRLLKAQAAAAAVAVALQMRPRQAQSEALKAESRSWQTVNRASQLNIKIHPQKKETRR